MDKTFKETIKSIRDAVLGREVRECIAQGMEYVESFASTAVTKAAEATQSAAQALASKNAAASSQTAAASSASAAKSSADAAAKSQTAAGQSEARVKTYADNASASAAAAAVTKNAVDQSAANAKTHADSASASAADAAASRDAAASSAAETKSLVDDAAASATAAAASKSAAAQSAAGAKQYSDSAGESAADASASNSAAWQSLAAAKAAADAAAASASSAKRYSDEAGAKASTDKTLSIPDAPADAKAVRDALDKLNANPDPTLSIEGAPAEAKAVGEALAGKSPTSHTHDLSALINALSIGTASPTDSDYFVSQYVGGGTTTTSYHRRPMSALWAYIKGKADAAYAATSHTHSYAGSASAGGSATSAVKLDTSAGSATQPVYFASGKPAACSYTLGKSVPSNAVFTDHTYSAATQSAEGLMSAADKQKLDGIAAGATGSNITASGNGYIRFSDGTQICWGEIVPSGYPEYYDLVNFEVPFVDNSYCVAAIKAVGISYDKNDDFYWVSKATTRVRIGSAYRANSYQSNERRSNVIAIGRWK